MHEKDVVRVVDSAKLEYIRLRMYKFTKETLRSTEEEAQISAFNAADAVEGIEVNDEGNEERAERMRLSIQKFCRETLKLSEEEAQRRAMNAALSILRIY